jgi:predicted AAA+ superfamily ATPase
LSTITDTRAANDIADGYARVITTMRMSQATDASARRAVEDEGIVLQKRFQTAYPFHPTLIDVMSQRWASLPDFQRTRGALRFLATCLYALKRDDKAHALLGPGDIPLYDADVRNAFFTEVGQREPFVAVLKHDFTDPNARASY